MWEELWLKTPSKYRFLFFDEKRRRKLVVKLSRKTPSKNFTVKICLKTAKKIVEKRKCIKERKIAYKSII